MARANPTSTGRQLRSQWPVYGPISVRTVTRRLNNSGLKARRAVKRPLLTPRHKRARLNWAHDRRTWNLRSWRRVHWSDECKFVLRHTDGRMRVWRETNTAYADRNIVGTTAFGGGSITVWACFSYRCKLDMYVLNGTLTGVSYRDNILRDIVVPHFDNHRLADRPIFMDDNARPHRAAIVRQYLQQEAVDVLPWPALSPDMNPIEHVWDQIKRKLDQRNPACRNLNELRAAVLQEWNLYPQNKLQRLVQGMRRRVNELLQQRGSYTKY
ncbi:MAG: transposase [Candidatus Thiodiazotropha sp.]